MTLLKALGKRIRSELIAKGVPVDRVICEDNSFPLGALRVAVKMLRLEGQPTKVVSMMTFKPAREITSTYWLNVFVMQIVDELFSAYKKQVDTAGNPDILTP